MKDEQESCLEEMGYLEIRGVFKYLLKKIKQGPGEMALYDLSLIPTTHIKKMGID